MVDDIKDEFKMILDEVKWMDEGDSFSYSNVILFPKLFCPTVRKTFEICG